MPVLAIKVFTFTVVTDSEGEVEEPVYTKDGVPAPPTWAAMWDSSRIKSICRIIEMGFKNVFKIKKKPPNSPQQLLINLNKIFNLL